MEETSDGSKTESRGKIHLFGYFNQWSKVGYPLSIQKLGLSRETTSTLELRDVFFIDGDRALSFIEMESV